MRKLHGLIDTRPEVLSYRVIPSQDPVNNSCQLVMIDMYIVHCIPTVHNIPTEPLDKAQGCECNLNDNRCFNSYAEGRS